MKVKVSTGGGMRGLVKYQKKSGCELISGSQLTAENFLRETAALRELRKDCKKPVLHFSLSQPPGESLSVEKWQQVTDKFLSKMNLQDNSYFAVRHTDTDHDHVHIAVNKIGSDGKLWDTDKSAIRAMKVCEEIERELNLTITKTLADHRKSGEQAPLINSKQIKEFERTGEIKSKSSKQRIQERIKNERKNKNRESCASTGSNTERLAGSPTSDHSAVQKHGSSNQKTRKGGRRIEENKDNQPADLTSKINDLIPLDIEKEVKEFIVKQQKNEVDYEFIRKQARIAANTTGDFYAFCLQLHKEGIEVATRREDSDPKTGRLGDIRGIMYQYNNIKIGGGIGRAPTSPASFTIRQHAKSI